MALFAGEKHGYGRPPVIAGLLGGVLLLSTITQTIPAWLLIVYLGTVGVGSRLFAAPNSSTTMGGSAKG